MSRSLALGLTIASIVWVAVLFAAPFGLASGSLAAVLVYQVGDLICHQQADRSFHITAVQMPVCARCLGLYVSGAAGALTAWGPTLWRDERVRTVRFALAAAALPTLITVGVEWIGLAKPSGIVRAAAALPLGLTAGWVFVRALAAGTSTATARMSYHA